MKLLLIKPSSMGDVIHAMPVIHAIKSVAPKTEITWLVNSSFADLVKCVRGVDKIIEFRRDLWKQKLKFWENLKNLLQLSKKLRKEKFDVVLDLQGLLRSAYFGWITGAKRRIGFENAREGSALFYTEKVPNGDKILHAIDANMKAFKCLFPEALPAPVSFNIDIPDSIFENVRASNPLLKTSFCILSPGARWESKKWPENYYKKLARMITEKSSLQVIVTGDKIDEKEWGQFASESDGKIISFCGKTSIRELAALISRSEFMVCNDSGPMHLGTAFGKFVFVLMGSTNPAKTGPYRGACVINLNLACSPCYRRECPRTDNFLECLRSISPEDVLTSIQGKGFL